MVSIGVIGGGGNLIRGDRLAGRLVYASDVALHVLAGGDVLAVGALLESSSHIFEYFR